MLDLGSKPVYMVIEARSLLSSAASKEAMGGIAPFQQLLMEVGSLDSTLDGTTWSYSHVMASLLALTVTDYTNPVYS